MGSPLQVIWHSSAELTNASTLTVFSLKIERWELCWYFSTRISNLLLFVKRSTIAPIVLVSTYLVIGQSTVASRTALLQDVNRKHCDGCDSRFSDPRRELELVSPLSTTSPSSRALRRCRFRTISDGPSVIKNDKNISCH